MANPNRNPAAVFPAEIWEMTFDKIENIQDWINVSNTDPLFRNVLRKDKVPGFFELVMPIVLDQSPSNLNLNPEDIKNLRMVSTSCKDSVDQSLSVLSHPSTQTLMMFSTVLGENYLSHVAPALPVIIDILQPNEDADKIQRILLNDNAALFSRHLIVKNLIYLERMLEEHPLFMLLEQKGTTILHFGVDSPYQTFSDLNVMRKYFQDVVRCLDFMPNLQTLFISQPSKCEASFPNNDWNYFGFPHLPDLEILQSQFLDHSILRSLLNVNRQVKKISIHCDNSAESGVIKNLVTFPSPALLRNLSECSLGAFVNGMEDIVSLKFVRWPLTKLSLYNDSWSFPIPDGPLFKTLGKFGGSLTHLFVGPLLNPRDDVVRVPAYLEKLKHLKLVMYGRCDGIQVVFMHSNGNQNNCEVIISDCFKS